MSKRIVVELLIEVDDGEATKSVVDTAASAVSSLPQFGNVVNQSGHIVDRRAKRVVLAQFPSESDSSKEPYKVCERTDGTLYCDCPGYQWNRTCWHIDLMEQRKATKKTK
jgi:hypothetical protein